MTKQDLIKQIEQWNPRSAWYKGVKGLMFILVDNAQEHKNIEFDDLINIVNSPQDLHKCADLLSYGGCLLIDDGDIAEMLCTPSVLKKKKYGLLQPNSRENWLDFQARACYQALRRLKRMFN